MKGRSRTGSEDRQRGSGLPPSPRHAELGLLSQAQAILTQFGRYEYFYKLMIWATIYPRACMLSLNRIFWSWVWNFPTASLRKWPGVTFAHGAVTSASRPPHPQFSVLKSPLSSGPSLARSATGVRRFYVAHAAALPDDSADIITPDCGCEQPAEFQREKRRWSWFPECWCGA